MTQIIFNGMRTTSSCHQPLRTMLYPTRTRVVVLQFLFILSSSNRTDRAVFYDNSYDNEECDEDYDDVIEQGDFLGDQLN